MSRTYQGQKAALTRAKNADNPIKVLEEVHRTIVEWREAGIWPDDWSRWAVAWGDAIEDLRRLTYDLFD